MKTRVLKALMVLFAAAFLALSGLLGLYAYTEEAWLSYRNVPFPPLVSVVHPGELVPLRVVRCSSRKELSNYVITRRLHNIDTDEYYVLGESNVQISPGCTDETSLANRAPETVSGGRPTSAGQYEIVGLARVPGMFRTFEVAWRSGRFRIEAR